MRNIQTILGAAGMALAISTFAAAAPGAPAKAESWAAKSCANPWKPAADSPDIWRWQAYHNLDCTIAFIDEQIGAPGSSGQPGSEDATVTVRREDLEKLRTMAIAAKDAAQRIGH
jgi:hypothetical protein